MHCFSSRREGLLYIFYIVFPLYSLNFSFTYILILILGHWVASHSYCFVLLLKIISRIQETRGGKLGIRQVDSVLHIISTVIAFLGSYWKLHFQLLQILLCFCSMPCIIKSTEVPPCREDKQTVLPLYPHSLLFSSPLLEMKSTKLRKGNQMLCAPGRLINNPRLSYLPWESLREEEGHSLFCVLQVYLHQQSLMACDSPSTLVAPLGMLHVY